MQIVPPFNSPPVVAEGVAEGWTYAMEQIVFSPSDATRDLWHLSDRQLAGVCRMIAEGRLANSTSILRAEAMRLFLVWLETLNAPQREREEIEQRACLLSGLRKRTIQVLIKLSRMSRPLTHEH